MNILEFSTLIWLGSLAAGFLYPFWGILLSPVFAAAAMIFSSVWVVSNCPAVEEGQALSEFFPQGKRYMLSSARKAWRR